MEEERGTFETHIVRHEGTLMIDLGRGRGLEPIEAALIVATQRQEGGEYALMWRVHSSMPTMAAAVARFLVLNPAFHQAVEGNLAMMVSGRMDGGMGEATDCGNPDCPVHGVQRNDPESGEAPGDPPA